MSMVSMSMVQMSMDVGIDWLRKSHENWVATLNSIYKINKSLMKLKINWSKWNCKKYLSIKNILMALMDMVILQYL